MDYRRSCLWQQCVEALRALGAVTVGSKRADCNVYFQIKKPVHSDRDQWKILEQVWSILKHFSAIAEEAFEAGATENISGPVPYFLAFETVQHQKLAIAMA